MNRKPYPCYKASGVPWLGEVPEHWDVKRLKMASQLSDKKVEADDANPLPYIGLENIESWTGKLLSIDPDVAPTGIAHSFQAEHTLFGKLRPYLAKACNPDFPGLCSTELLVIEGKNFDRRALLYWMLADGFVNLVDSSTYGSKMPRANWNFIGNCRLPVPPRPEQTAIADFLDRQTGRIDLLMQKKRELIARLKEKRTALVARTVTRGLPPDAAREFGLEPHTRFKDSGIDWLGEVPEGWEIIPLKFKFPRLYSGVSVNSENIPVKDGLMGILKTSCVHGNYFHPEENKKVLDDELGRVICPVTENSLIISRMNTPDLVGNCGYVEIDHPTLYLPDRLWIAQFSKHKAMHGKFAWYLVTSHGLSCLNGVLATGTSGSMKNLSQDAFLNIVVALPAEVEQTVIATYLDRETAKLDRLTEKVKTAITRLQEYRTALITAAVTGKIDVREQAA
ncbi:MAG: restriction endonuclease subunit S [Magnetococcales bacterium]|nr:restriction endonuclease subunit S [Magnetococcales bacterium]